MNKKVAVIGGAGYIGGVTVDTLLENGYEPYVYDNLLYEDRYLKDVPFLFGDIKDTGKVVNFCKDCNTVILLAAIVGDPACNVNPDLTEKVNYWAVKNICDNLPKNKRVIFTSTCSVYGANDNLVNEFSETRPLSSYASTKLKAESHVIDRGGIVFRLGTVYGVGDKFSRIRSDLVVNTLTIKAFIEGKITVNGGDQWRPIISVKDVAGYLSNACNEYVPNLYNISYKNVRISDISDIIQEAFPDVSVTKIDLMFEDLRNYKVDNDLSVKTFSYVPKFTVELEMLELKNLLVQGRIKDPANIIYNNGLYLSSRRI